MFYLKEFGVFYLLLSIKMYLENPYLNAALLLSDFVI